MNTSDDLRPPRTVDDLCRVTGLGKDSVRACIRTGELPGVYVQPGSDARGRYVVPAEAFDRFVRGEWRPDPRPVFTHDITPIQPIQRRRREASA